jgi:hypothetical protein
MVNQVGQFAFCNGVQLLGGLKGDVQLSAADGDNVNQ